VAVLWVAGVWARHWVVSLAYTDWAAPGPQPGFVRAATIASSVLIPLALAGLIVMLVITVVRALPRTTGEPR
jgi:hypothetical protein